MNPEIGANSQACFIPTDFHHAQWDKALDTISSFPLGTVGT